MKKVFLTAVALATFGYSQAQDKTSTQVTFGAKAGLNVSSLSLSENLSFDLVPLYGFHVGGFVNIPLSEKVSFQPELLYSMQGHKEELSTKDETYDGKKAINYLNVPLNIQFEVMDKLFLEAGAQIGFVLSGYDKYTYKLHTNTTSYTISKKTDAEFAFKRFDYGINIGAGYYFTDNMFANARYTLGLPDIDENSVLKTKNRVLQLSVGYKF